MIIAVATLRFADYFILVGYFVLMLGIGGFFYRRMRRMKDYFTGGNQIPWWLSGVSYYMSCFSVFAFVVYAGLAYEHGMLGVTVFWIMAPATLVSALVFSKRWRRARIDSPVEYLETRYGQVVRQMFAWQNIPVRIIDDALKVVAIGLFISEGLGVDREQSMLWSGLVMLVYTLMGGLWAVAVTDFVQFIVMLAAILVVLPLSLARIGGIGNLIENAPAGFFRPTSGEYDAVYIVSTLFMFLLAFSSVNWSLIQRYYCVPKERDAVKVGWLVFALSVVGPPAILIPAMAARQFLPALDHPNQVYPLLCVELLPAGMLGLVIAAMFSATMSMLSSDYNVCASVLTNDVYRRYVRPTASQPELVLVGRLMTLVVGTLSLGTAFYLARQKDSDLFRSMVKLFSVATAPVALPMIAGLVSRRITNFAALYGYLAGISVGLMYFFLGPDRLTIHFAEWLGQDIVLLKESALIWLTAGSTLIGMIVASEAQPMVSEPERIDAFRKRLDAPIGTLPEDRDDEPATRGSAPFSPFGVVGLSTLLIGVMLLAVLPFLKRTLAFQVNTTIGLSLSLAGLGMIWASRRAVAASRRAAARQS